MSMMKGWTRRKWFIELTIVAVIVLITAFAVWSVLHYYL